MLFNKLVRDKIPEIIENQAQTAVTETLSQEDFKKYLDLKLNEELAEYLESDSVEELADLTEVIYALIKLKGRSPDDFEKIRLDKTEERGAFDRRILLKEVL
jgi:predicted house-cleaning noncanonical NTP pyrophosphatase (MazG superfamily)